MAAAKRLTSCTVRTPSINNGKASLHSSINKLQKNVFAVCLLIVFCDYFHACDTFTCEAIPLHVDVFACTFGIVRKIITNCQMLQSVSSVLNLCDRHSQQNKRNSGWKCECLGSKQLEAFQWNCNFRLSHFLLSCFISLVLMLLPMSSGFSCSQSPGPSSPPSSRKPVSIFSPIAHRGTRESSRHPAQNG